MLQRARKTQLPPAGLFKETRSRLTVTHTHVLRLLFLTVQSSFQGAMSWLVYNVLVATIFFTFDVNVFSNVI